MIRLFARGILVSAAGFLTALPAAPAKSQTTHGAAESVLPSDAQPYVLVVFGEKEAAFLSWAIRERIDVVPLMPKARIFGARLERSQLAFARSSNFASSIEQDVPLAHVRANFSIPPNDPRYGGQWYLDRIEIESAWAYSSGDPDTTIAVIDNGCDPNHPDLRENMLPGYDAVDDDDDPAYTPNAAGNEHGTACAGLVAADSNNELGIAGTCPLCTVRCVRLLAEDGTKTSISTDVRAFNFVLESDVAVASNSWGFEEGTPVPRSVKLAIETLSREGRGGLGTLVVFAAGNDSSEIHGDELQAISEVLTVGAVNNFDEAAPFSNFGASLGLTAPTGTLTLDIHGSDGASEDDFTSLFGGTSSSCPVVAGVAGLMLTVNPSLRAQEAHEMLLRTTRSAPFATPDADGHDVLYGYGIVDPARAVAEAASSIPGGRATDGGVEPDAATEPDAGERNEVPPTQSSGGCAFSHPATSRTETLPTAALLLLALSLRRFRGQRRRKHIAEMCVFIVLWPAIGGCSSFDTSSREKATGGRSDELRPDSPGSTELPPRFEDNEVIETFASNAGAFRVTFTREGENAVPETDADDSGVPDYVEEVASLYDEVLAQYLSIGFLAPPTDEAVDVHGEDSRFDVYLVDFAGSADGAFRREECYENEGCTGYMLHENDFAGYGYPSRSYANRLLASHEFFHAIQARYDSGEAAASAVLSEGTAVWASERFDASLRDLETFSDGYLSRTDRSLGADPIGPVQSFSYGSGIFFQHLSDEFGDDVIVALWEAMQNDGSDASWLTVLDAVLIADYHSTFADTFFNFSNRIIFSGELAQSEATIEPIAGAEGFSEVSRIEIALPYEDESVRMAPASARYFEAPADEGTLEARAFGANGLHSFAIAVLQDERIVEVASAFETNGISHEFAATADRVIVGLIDTRSGGSGDTLSFCVGSPESIDECESKYGSHDEPDAGTDGTQDAGAVDPGVDASGPAGGGGPDSESGCAISTHASGKPHGATVFFMFFFGACLFGVHRLTKIRFHRSVHVDDARTEHR